MTNLSFYEEVLICLNKNQVKYLVVGGFAVNIYGYMRSTGDLDLWIANDNRNLVKLKNALMEMGYSEGDILTGIEEVRHDKNINLLQDDYIKVELIPVLLTRLDFITAFQNRENKSLFGLDVNVISFENLCEIKIRSGRDKDLLDVKELKRIMNL